METELLSLGIDFKHSRPYHPETCGKVLFPPDGQEVPGQAASGHDAPAATTPARPFRDVLQRGPTAPSHHRRTPLDAFEALRKARPRRKGIDIDGYRVRHDKVDDAGSVTLRYKSRLHHSAVGRRYARQRVTLLVAGRDIRILDESHTFIRRLTLDPSRDYQRQG
jgi:hypothetical protein